MEANGNPSVQDDVAQEQAATVPEAEATETVKPAEIAEGNEIEDNSKSRAAEAEDRFNRFVFDDEKKKKKKKKVKKPKVPLPTRKELQAIVDELTKMIARKRKSVAPLEAQEPKLYEELVKIQEERLNSHDMYEKRAEYLSNSIAKLTAEKEAYAKKRAAEAECHNAQYKEALKKYETTKAFLFNKIELLDAQLSSFSEWSYVRKICMDKLAEIKWESPHRFYESMNAVVRRAALYRRVLQRQAQERLTDFIETFAKTSAMQYTARTNQLYRRNQILWLEWKKRSAAQVLKVKRAQEAENQTKIFKLDFEIVEDALKNITEKIEFHQLIIRQLERRYKLLRINENHEYISRRIYDWVMDWDKRRLERERKFFQMSEKYEQSVQLSIEVEQQLHATLEQFKQQRHEFLHMKMACTMCFEALLQAAVDVRNNYPNTGREMAMLRAQRKSTAMNLVGLLLKCEDPKCSVLKDTHIEYRLGMLGLFPIKQSACKQEEIDDFSSTSSSAIHSPYLKTSSAYSKHIITPSPLPSSAPSLQLSKLRSVESQLYVVNREPMEIGDSSHAHGLRKSPASSKITTSKKPQKSLHPTKKLAAKAKYKAHEVLRCTDHRKPGKETVNLKKN